MKTLIGDQVHDIQLIKTSNWIKENKEMWENIKYEKKIINTI